MTANRLNCNLTDTFSHIRDRVDYTIAAVSFVALAMNLGVIVCGLKIFSRKNRDTIHIYIISMTTADLANVVCLFLESVNRVLPLNFVLASHFSYFLVNFFSWLSWAVSGLSLVLLNSDKLLFFCFPLYYRLVKSTRRAILLSLSVWAVSFCFVAYLWLNEAVKLVPSKHEEIILRWSLKILSPGHYTLFMALFCLLPICSSLLVSCYLFQLMRLKRKESESSSLRGSHNYSHLPVAPAFSNKLRSLVFIFTTTVWTAFSLLPFRVFLIVKLNFITLEELIQDCAVFNVFAVVAWMLYYLLMMNPVVNPFITATIYHPYRMALSGAIKSRLPFGSVRTLQTVVI